MTSPLKKLDLLADCRRYSISWWQCPQVIFLLIGLIIILALLATYFIGTRVIEDPMTVALLVVVLAAVLMVLDYIIMQSFEKLAEAARLRSDFIGIISHQMRTPLANLKWAMELLSREWQKNQEAGANLSEYFVMVRENSDRLSGLIQELLLVAKLEGQTLPVRPESFSLAEMGQKVIQEFTAFAAAHNLKIEFKADPALPAVFADPFLIRQVVANLLDNAVKYSREPGVIAMTLARQGQKVLLQIKDQGLGIDNQEQKRIFDKFFRGENTGKKQVVGSGLGLFIARGIIEKSGGQIGFASQENQGSTFWFTLPLAKR